MIKYEPTITNQKMTEQRNLDLTTLLPNLTVTAQWRDYSRRIKAIAFTQDILGAIDGSMAPDHANFAAANKTALLLIISTISSKVMDGLEAAGWIPTMSARDTWTRLETIMGRPSNEKVFYLLEELIEINRDNFSSLQDYLNHFQFLVRLVETRITITDKMWVPLCSKASKLRTQTGTKSGTMIS